MIRGRMSFGVAVLVGAAVIQAGVVIAIPALGLTQQAWDIVVAGLGAVVLIAAFWLLLPRREQVLDLSHLIRRCPVCDLVLYREGKYCPKCGV